MEDFVNFEIAKKLKEKGFRKPCILYYNSDKVRTWFNEPYIAKDFVPTTLGNDDVLAPTISQVLKWLREEKKLYVGVTYSPKIEGSQDFFYATIQYIGDYKKTIYPNDSYDNWEEAALNGIKYAIDNNLIL